MTARRGATTLSARSAPHRPTIARENPFFQASLLRRFWSALGLWRFRFGVALDLRAANQRKRPRTLRLIRICEVRPKECESQRDSRPKPRVARNELPWENVPSRINPNGVAARICSERWQCFNGGASTPSGLIDLTGPTQGSSFLATLGWQTQSLWD